MELHQLRYFLTVAKTLHFNRAAKLLHITQQPLSYQIKQLEEELGFKLFERNTRSVALTQAGKVFQAEVQAGLNRIERGVELAKRHASGELGILNISYASSMLYNILPPILRQFKDCFPDLDVRLTQLVEAESDTLQFQLLNEIVDVVLTPFQFYSGDVDTTIAPPINTRAMGLTREIIIQESIMVALPNQHPLAQHEVIALQDLVDEQFVMLDRRAGRLMFDEFISLCNRNGFSPTISYEATTGPEMVGLVAARLGVTLIPMSLSNLWAGDVVYRRLVDPPLTVEIAMLWKEGRQLPWLAELRRIARETRQWFSAGEK